MEWCTRCGDYIYKSAGAHICLNNIVVNKAMPLPFPSTETEKLLVRAVELLEKLVSEKEGK